MKELIEVYKEVLNKIKVSDIKYHSLYCYHFEQLHYILSYITYL